MKPAPKKKSKTPDSPFDAYLGLFKGTFKDLGEINRWIADLRDDNESPQQPTKARRKKHKT